MSTDPNEIVARAEDKARRMIEEAKREATIRKALAVDFGHIPPPRSVFLSSGYRGNDPQVWLTWELPWESYDPDDHRTPGGYWREGRRILEAFDWQTIAVKKDSTITVGPEAGINYDADDDVQTYDGMILDMDAGKGYGPSVELIAWTELPQLLNEGWFKLKVKFLGRALPQMDLARVVEIPGTRQTPARKEKHYPHLDHASKVIRWWSTEDSVRVSYIIETDDWEHFAELQQAEMGD